MWRSEFFVHFCEKNIFFLLPLPKKIIIIFGRGSEKKPFFHFSNFLLTSPTKESNFLVDHLLSPKKFFLLPLPWGRSEKKSERWKKFSLLSLPRNYYYFFGKGSEIFFFTLSKKNFVYRRKWNIFHSCEKINFFYFPYLKIIIYLVGEVKKKFHLPLKFFFL